AMCRGWPSPVGPPDSWQRTSGAADVAGRAPAPICRPGSPSRSALGADAQGCAPAATGGQARLPPCGRPPQRGLPRLASAVSPAGGWPKSLVRPAPQGQAARWRVEGGGAGPPPLHPMTGWPSRFPASPPRLPIGSPYGALALVGERRADHVPHASHWVRDALPVGRWGAIGGGRGG